MSFQQLPKDRQFKTALELCKKAAEQGKDSYFESLVVLRHELPLRASQAVHRGTLRRSPQLRRSPRCFAYLNLFARAKEGA